LVFLLKGGVP